MKRGLAHIARIEALPLLDVIFLLLLVLFYSISSMRPTVPVPIQLPGLDAGAESRSADPERDLSLAVDAEGLYYFDGRCLPLAEIEGLLAEAVAERDDLRVRVEADRAAQHGQVLTLLAAVSAVRPAEVQLIGVAGEPAR